MARRTFSAPERLLDRIREQHFASGAGPPDIDNPVEIHLLLEVQVKVGERAAPTIAAARWRFFSSVRASGKVSGTTARG